MSTIQSATFSSTRNSAVPREKENRGSAIGTGFKIASVFGALASCVLFFKAADNIACVQPFRSTEWLQHNCPSVASDYQIDTYVQTFPRKPACWDLYEDGVFSGDKTTPSKRFPYCTPMHPLPAYVIQARVEQCETRKSDFMTSMFLAGTSTVSYLLGVASDSIASYCSRRFNCRY